MRSAKEEGNIFPYAQKNLCYIEIPTNKGDIIHIPHKNEEEPKQLLSAINRTKTGESKLYAILIGSWSAEMFEIDDLDACENAIMQNV